LVTQWGSLTTPVVFAAAGWAAAWGGIEQPSRASLLVSLVPRAALPKAVTVAATLQSLAFASGPVLAGGLLALGNPWIAYLTHAALMLLSALLLRTLPPCHPPPVEDRPGVFSQMVEGAQFVKQRPAIWGCMTLDMVAVIFGGATALLPVYAKDVLDAGPAGYGILAASLELGALATSLLLTMRRPIVSAGRALLVTVAVFGLATMAFGASTSLPLSMAALFVVGASDQVSVVLRHTIVQLATPDALRGRVSAINMLFVHASNQLGAFESGALAAATSAPFSVVFGGFAAVVTAVTMAGLNRELHRYRVDHTNEAA
jgi:MFS family permease